jgi:hypothetical protein
METTETKQLNPIVTDADTAQMVCVEDFCGTYHFTNNKGQKDSDYVSITGIWFPTLRIMRGYIGSYVIQPDFVAASLPTEEQFWDWLNANYPGK